MRERAAGNRDRTFAGRDTAAGKGCHRADRQQEAQVIEAEDGMADAGQETVPDRRHLGAAEGHPAAVMDMSFAGQALSAEFAVKHHATLTAGVHTLPAEVDREIARLKLEALGVTLDPMTAEQERYVNSWQEGT